MAESASGSAFSVPAATPGRSCCACWAIIRAPRSGAHRRAPGRPPIGEVFPQLAVYDLPTLVKVDDVDVGGLDVVFCCLPHATTQAIVKALPRGPKVVDLSADFRLRDPQLYEHTYGHAHQALELQEQAVYGLTEHYRDAIRPAGWSPIRAASPPRPSCPLVPLLQRRLIHTDGIIIDAKSGVSGAGRDANRAACSPRSPRASTPMAWRRTGTRRRSSSASPISPGSRCGSPSRRI